MTEHELARGAARRLAIIRHAQEATGNVSRTCRYYGVTRQAYYGWLRRNEDLLWKGNGIAPGGPTPVRTPPVGQIVYLRQSYHYGPHKIAMYLKRYHDVRSARRGCGGS